MILHNHLLVGTRKTAARPTAVRYAIENRLNRATTLIFRFKPNTVRKVY